MLVKYLDPKTKLIGLKDNETGKIVLEAQYTQIGNSKDLDEPDLFVNGYAILHKPEKIVRNGKPSIKIYLGTVAPNGQILAPCYYAEISSEIKNGRIKFLKPVVARDKTTVYLYGYFALDSKNNKMPEVVPAKYLELGDFIDGYASGKTLEVEKVYYGVGGDYHYLNIIEGISLDGKVIERCQQFTVPGIDWFLESYRKKWREKEDEIQKMIHEDLKPIKEEYKRRKEMAESDAEKLKLVEEFKQKREEIEDRVRKEYDERKRLQEESSRVGI